MKILEEHKEWPAVKEVYQRLHENGYQALLAGGCVRDALLGVSPRDFDIATNARPEVVEGLFPRSIGVGKRFGVMIIPFEGFHIEVATFRVDKSYEDGRRPTEVVFCTPEEDAARRDFTINALFYDFERDAVVDFVDGEADLRRSLIRAVGRASSRFEEDKLRMLRAVRFAAQLGFQIEDETYQAIKGTSCQIGVVAHERIRQEVVKILSSHYRTMGLSLLEESLLLREIFPEWDLLVESGGWVKTKLRLDSMGTPYCEELAWTLFGYAMIEHRGATSGIQIVEQRLKELCTPRKILDETLDLLKKLSSWKDFMALRLGERAQIWAKHPILWRAKERLEFIECGDLSDELKHEREAMDHIFCEEGKLPSPFLTGQDLLKMGYSSGPKFGEWLNELYAAQLEGSIRSRNEALAHLEQLRFK